MTSLQAYQSLLIKVNRNDSNSNIHVPRGKFVVIFNQQQRNWLKEYAKRNLGSDELDSLYMLLVDNQPLPKEANFRDYTNFTLPDDFYRFSPSYCLANRGECKDRPLIVWNTKAKNLRDLLRSENHNPSFDYEETICSITGGKVSVFFSDFSISEFFLSYYRFAKDIDLEGYINLDGTPSKTIDPELGDDLIDDILDLCAAEIMRSNENPEGFQFAKDRIADDRQ